MRGAEGRWGRRAAGVRSRRVWRRRLVVGAAVLGVAVCAVAVYLLLWGRFSPYAPVVLGFDKAELAHVVVYVEERPEDDTAHAAGEGTSDDVGEGSADGAAGRSTEGLVPPADPHDLAWVDELAEEVESAHTLRFKSRPRLLFFRDRDTYARRTTTNARACTYYNGTIVVSPWVQQEDAEGVLSLEVYLRHELSHALLYQHMGVRTARHYPKWLLEGLATWSAGQRGTFAYPGRDETYALVAEGNWMPPGVYRTSGEDEVRLDVADRMTFMYSEFACIVEDLVAQHGREAFFGYVIALMDEDDHDAVFRQAFHTGFASYLAAFRSRVEEAADVVPVTGGHAAPGVAALL